MVQLVALAEPVPLWRDLVTLVKPGVSAWNVLMVVGGLAMAGARPSLDALVALTAIAVLVAAGGALNMALESSTDRRMPRAANRPVAAGRLSRGRVGALSLLAALGALAVLVWQVNPWTAALGAGALILYAGIYTPLKTVTPWAVVPGALAGALPPLLGWTAATGTPGGPGLALFFLLLVWQCPHVLAISLRHEAEYARAGLWVPSMALGGPTTRLLIFLTASATVSISLVLGVLGLSGGVYLLFAILGGGALVFTALRGLERSVPARWPRRMQGVTVLYLLALSAGLSLDGLL